jgi:hypothetical protein
VSTARSFLHIAALGILCLLLRRTAYPLLRLLPEEVYFDRSIVLASLTQGRVLPWLLAALAIAWLGRGALRWKEFDDAHLIRLPLSAVICLLAWTFSAYAYNGYYDQPHLFDRGLVVAAAIAALVRPAFVPLFFVIVTLVAGQFRWPLGYSMTDLALLVHVLLCAIAWLVVRSFHRIEARALLALWLIILSASYFDAAVKKWTLSPHGLEWVTHNDLANLFVASHLSGWLPDLAPAQVLVAAERIHQLAVPLQAITFAIELLPLVMLASRRMTLALLAAFVAMHAGIFCASGINFYKWSIVDIAVAIVLWRAPSALWWSDRRRALLFAALAAPAILLGGRLGFGSSLGWFDTPLTECHSFWAYADDGAEYALPESAFVPYDKTFAQDRFYYLHDEQPLVSTLGATNDFSRFTALQAALDAESITALRTTLAPRRANKAATLNFDRFVQRMMCARNAGRTGSFWPGRLGGPMHIRHGAPRDRTLPDDAIVTAVRVRFHRLLYTLDAIETLDERVVHEVPIPSCPP